MSEKSENQKKKYKRSPTLTASIILVFLSIVLLITLAMFTSFDEVTNRLEAGKVDIVLIEPHWNPENGDEIVPNTFVEKDPTVKNKEETVNTYVFLEVIVPYDDDPNLIIEKAYQNGTNDENNEAGKEFYVNHTPEHPDTPIYKVPYYKFVATGETIGVEPYKTVSADENLSDCYDSGYSYKQKINDTSWKLLKGYPIDDTENKTWIYVYAYVQDNSDLLQPLIANATVQMPLFNEIYLLNFRERDRVVDEHTGTVTQTPFPDPARNYSIRINAYGMQAEFLRPNNGTTNVPEDVWLMLNPSYNSAYTPGTPLSTTP